MAHLVRLSLLSLVLLIPIACADTGSESLLAPDAPDAKLEDAPGLTVMTRNLYLGADIDPLLAGGDPSAALANALAQLQQTNFFARAYALAGEIVTQQPHLVGLQEVSRYLLPPATGLPSDIDYLGILMFAIQDLGGQYYVAASQENVALSLPLVVNQQYLGDIVYMDGDAILARMDVPTGAVENHHFDAQQTLAVGGVVFDNLRGWNAVEATAAGQTFRFVNTHLEIQPFRDVQVQQAQELVDAYADDELPVIMVGDFNSAANPHPTPDQATDSYHIFRNAGFADMWLRESDSSGGLTCCQDPGLINADSELHSRLDLVLVRYGAAGFGGHSWMDVLGEDVGDRFDAGGYLLWPSDHAGVVATLWPAPGLRARFGD